MYEEIITERYWAIVSLIDCRKRGIKIDHNWSRLYDKKEEAIRKMIELQKEHEISFYLIEIIGHITGEITEYKGKDTKILYYEEFEK